MRLYERAPNQTHPRPGIPTAIVGAGESRLHSRRIDHDIPLLVSRDNRSFSARLFITGFWMLIAWWTGAGELPEKVEVNRPNKTV